MSLTQLDALNSNSLEDQKYETHEIFFILFYHHLISYLKHIVIVLCIFGHRALLRFLGIKMLSVLKSNKRVYASYYNGDYMYVYL